MLVCSLLDDASVVENDDAVCVTDGGEAMRDDKRGAPFHDRVHSLLHEAFRVSVDATGCLIENQHRRIGYGSTGNGKQLALALTESRTISLL